MWNRPGESGMAFVLNFPVFDAMIVSYQINGHWLDAWNFVPCHFSQTSSGAYTNILGRGTGVIFLRYNSQSMKLTSSNFSDFVCEHEDDLTGEAKTYCLNHLGNVIRNSVDCINEVFIVL
jgi:hypothetical protein